MIKGGSLGDSYIYVLASSSGGTSFVAGGSTESTDLVDANGVPNPFVAYYDVSFSE